MNEKRLSEPVLDISGLTVEFPTEHGPAEAVSNVSLSVHQGETLAVVGESGSGKSVTARAAMGLVGYPGKMTAGAIRIAGEDVSAYSQRRWRSIRGERIAMVYQDSLSALNPVFTVGQQLAESFRVHRKMGARAAHREAVSLLDRVRIPDAQRRVDQYPHEFSGGMRQRAMIAMSIALNPKVLIADEPTTALDVTVQAQILDLLDELKREQNMGLILITHDLGVVAQRAQRVAVMYSGRVVEETPTPKLFTRPAHGYTSALIRAIPRIDGARGELKTIPGMPPQLWDRGQGCAFAPRCDFAVDACHQTPPPAVEVEPGHISACHEWERITL